jgi:ligand-binding sensor domain-containing protein
MKHFFISFILLYSSLVFPQHLAYKQFTINDGLPSSEVYNVMQDSKGFIWFCTDAGVSRYNGYSFKNFSREDGLPDNNVYELFEDNQQRIWTRTLSGNLAYIRNDSITAIKAKVDKRKNPTSFIVTDKNEIVLSLYNDQA